MPSSFHLNDIALIFIKADEPDWGLCSFSLNARGALIMIWDVAGYQSMDHPGTSLFLFKQGESFIQERCSIPVAIRSENELFSLDKKKNTDGSRIPFCLIGPRHLSSQARFALMCSFRDTKWSVSYMFWTLSFQIGLTNIRLDNNAK